jgi:phage/plasmid-like protein (TIGR03299 family)
MVPPDARGTNVMSHNIDESNGRYNIAFLGSRNAIWHRHGHEMLEGMTIDDWQEKAGLLWSAEKVPLYVEWNGSKVLVPNVKAIQRSDTGLVLGTGSDIYQVHQPRENLEWCQRYVDQDSRFKIDVAGSLKQGRIIWVTAVFDADGKGGIEIAGHKHVIRLLMSTTFDASAATINKLTDTRVVCNNTLDVALGGDHRAEVRTRHNTKFDADKVSRELEGMAQSVEKYKAFGDRMAETRMAKETVSKYFKRLLDIPFDVKAEDVSTRKMNQFSDLNRCYGQTVQEGTAAETAWAGLNAVTRYVDHDKSTRGGDANESRFLSAQFGSGAAMKSKAVQLLTADDEFAELLKRPFVSTVTSRTDSDVAALLARPFAKV